MIDEKMLIEDAFMQKYGVCIDGGMPKTATGLEALCHRVYNKGWEDCRERILNKRWIPCIEKMPTDTDAKYIVTVKDMRSGNLYVTTDTLFKYHKRTLGISREYDWMRDWSCQEVIAWMPLPEPFKEGGAV